MSRPGPYECALADRECLSSPFLGYALYIYTFTSDLPRREVVFHYATDWTEINCPWPVLGLSMRCSLQVCLVRAMLPPALPPSFFVIADLQ
eukprot:scaffold942_cov366-Prasinococcus_capsulatus_cf.AAC.2